MNTFVYLLVERAKTITAMISCHRTHQIAMLLVLYFFWLPLSGALKDSPEKPNVIIVITDDQGMGDLACHGNPFIKTPSLGEFHGESLRFTNFHVSTTCAPTRGALMTGRHTNRVNVFHTISGRSILWEDEVILAQVFGQNGYVNGMFGKWHLGDNYPYRPEDRGFQEVVRHGGGGVGQSPDYWGNDYFNDTYWHNGAPEAYQGYCTDVFFQEALKFIESNQDRPFFCYISTNAPHGPLNLPEDYYNLYKDVDEIDEGMKRFYGMITNIDDNFRLLREKLEELDIAENTLLIFMTDNGTAGGNRVFNAGLRGEKGSEYDGGHRVPFFIYWPNGGIEGGKDLPQLTAHYDLLPTFVDLLDLDHAPVKTLDGTSLVPLLKGETENWPKRILYMDTQRLQNLVKYRRYSVMQENWRLVNGDELYDMSKDRAQEQNVIEQHPEVAMRLAVGYERWWQSIMSEGPNERYAHIKAGSSFENPTRVSVHDMLTGNPGWMWHQRGIAGATQTHGVYKIEFVEGGNYRIALRRFPRESGLAINATFPAQEKRIEIEQPLPASVKNDFVKAWLFVADLNQRKGIEPGQEEVVFEAELPPGRFDMQAELIDSENRSHPAYYVYIEKLD